LIEHLLQSIDKAERYESKLTSEILNVSGFTSIKIRHFLNNICTLPELKYLEIGILHGSTLTAAIYQNEGDFTGIDDFSEFNVSGNAKDLLMGNLEKFKMTPRVINNDCWSPETIALCPSNINVYFYDGDHVYDAQRQALNAYWEHLANEFLFFVDDWNWDATRTGTLDSFQDKPVEILYQKEIYTPGKTNGNADHWWNGFGIFCLKKKT